MKMNDAKTEYIQFGSVRQLDKCESTMINCNGTAVKKTNCIKHLGAYLDKTVSMRQHITQKSRAAAINLQKIRIIRKYLTQEAAQILVSGLVTSHLDYANAILYGLRECEIKKYQRLQNFAAKNILGISKYDSSRDALKQLHWLPIRLRIVFKIAVLVFKCINGIAPTYFFDLLQPKTIRREGLRSESTAKSDSEPQWNNRKTFADRAFSHSGPLIWNTIPVVLRDTVSLKTFKAGQKRIFLFVIKL